MDLQKMITELQAEKTQLDEAILALERLSAGKLRRRGKPPGWIAEPTKRSSNTNEKREDSAAAS